MKTKRTKSNWFTSLLLGTNLSWLPRFAAFEPSQPELQWLQGTGGFQSAPLLGQPWANRVVWQLMWEQLRWCGHCQVNRSASMSLALEKASGTATTQQCSEEKAACVQHPQHTAAVGVIACAAGSRSTVPPLSGDQLTYWQSLRPQIYHGLH